MNSKINANDLNNYFIDNYKISKSKSETFVKNFFDVIIAGLEKDGVVKITGLGTFKLVEVGSRGSVDVNTGERIEIAGHKKVSFLPDNALKEIVNKPFSMFDIVELADGQVVKDTEEKVQNDTEEEEDEEETAFEESVATPVSKPVAPVQETVTASPETVPAVQEEPVADTAAIAPNETAVPEPVPAAQEEPVAETAAIAPNETAAPEAVPAAQEEPVAETAAIAPNETATPEAAAQEKEPNKNEETVVPVVETLSVEATETAPAAGPAPTREEETKEEIKEEVKQEKQEPTVVATKPKKPSHKGVVIGIIIALVLLLALATAAIFLYFIPASRTSTVAKSTVTVTPAPVKPQPVAVQPADTLKKSAEPAIEVGADGERILKVTLSEADEVKPLSGFSMRDTLHYAMSGLLCSHTVASDETLIKISLKYYGTKKLWPYIAKYNGIRDADGLCRGMTLKVPILTAK